MGVRFACHHCGKSLNIKTELAGKRGICPACRGKFRIPASDAKNSLAIEASDAKTTDPTNLGEQQASGQSQIPKEQVQQDTQEPLVSEADHAPVAKTATRIGAKVLAPNPQAIATVLSEFDDAASWYVRPPSGGQYGPANTEIFAQWIGEGRVAATSLVWRDGWPQWRSATDAFPDLSDRLPGVTEESIASPVTARRSQNDDPKKSAASHQSSPENHLLSGEHHFGQQKRKRSLRRVASIIALAVIAIALIGTLLFITNR